MRVWVGRSPWRMFAYVVAGAALVLMAVDMTISYRFFEYPDHTESVSTLEDGTEVTDRVLTLDGQSQRRRDLAFGFAFAAGGGALLLWAVGEAVFRRPVLVADSTGLQLQLGTRRVPPMQFTWAEIAEARSGERDDGAGSMPVLSLRMADPDSLPERVRSAVADPPWLHLIADDWDVPARQVAPAIALFAGGGEGDEYH